MYHRGAGDLLHRFYECIGAYDVRWLRTPAGWRATSRRFEAWIELGDRSVLRPD